MQTQDLTEAFADRLSLAPDEASRTLRATLTAIGRALPEEEADAAADQLPAEIASYLRAGGAAPDVDDLEVLVVDVAESLGTDGRTAQGRLEAGFLVLRDALDEGEWIELVTALPAPISDMIPS